MTFLHTHILPVCLRASPDSRLKGSQDRRKKKDKDQRWSRATNSSQRSPRRAHNTTTCTKDRHHTHSFPPHSSPHAPSRLQQSTSFPSSTYLPGSFRPMSRNSGRGRCCWYCGCPYACASAPLAKQRRRRTGEKDARPQ